MAFASRASEWWVQAQSAACMYKLSTLNVIATSEPLLCDYAGSP